MSRKRTDNFTCIVCAICDCREPLATAHDHHRKPRAFGGTDEAENRVWLCASCHARLHRVQGLIARRSTASAFDLCNSIFPTDGKARGQLWILANEAASIEIEVKESFAAHRTEASVQLTLDAELWAIIKAQARARRVSAVRHAADLLRVAVRGKEPGE